MNNQLKAVAYARVSTLLGQDPEHQLVHIRKFSKARDFQLTNEYVDLGVSGSKEKRPSLDQLVIDARMGKFKVLIVSGIDRIGRNTRHLLNLIHELSGYGVSLISLRENMDFTTPMGQATLTILGAIAELERELTRERIRTALAAKKIEAKRLGKKWSCGRPKSTTEALRKQILELRAKGLSIRAIERRLDKKVSRTTIQRIIKKATVSKG
ncbi:MAG: recombinase family protein [Bdellovibrionota bacterium]|nr:recombinase family protein [Bdellovibrionota bacterium]MEC8625146.1 recombinase family protein [Bdellovibrionota bacterium]